MPLTLCAGRSRRPSSRLSPKLRECVLYQQSFATQTIFCSLSSTSSIPRPHFPTLSLLLLPSYRFLSLLYLLTSSIILHLFPFRGNLRALSRSLSILLRRAGGLPLIPSSPELTALYTDKRYTSQYPRLIFSEAQP